MPLMNRLKVKARRQLWELAECVMVPTCSFMKRKEGVLYKYYIRHRALSLYPSRMPSRNGRGER